jgi:hypothetical protein
MNTPASPAARRLSPGAVLVALAVLALVAYFLWSRSESAAESRQAAGAAEAADASAAAERRAAAGIARAAAPAVPAGMPAGAHYEGGILVDAQGQRILSAAGLPIGPPLPPAPPLPVKAAPNDVVGYTTDANGVSRPLKAKDYKAAENAPGTYAVVDLWAEGGPAVVPATEGHRLSDAEAAKLRAAEAERDRRASAER